MNSRTHLVTALAVIVSALLSQIAAAQTEVINTKSPWRVYWRDGPRLAGANGKYGIPHDKFNGCRNADPPADWTAPEFNDRDWAYRGIEGGRYGGESGQGIPMVCSRGRFGVNDPAKVSSLSLNLAYRGGVIIYVNGKEIGRKNMPAGQVKAETLADDYPEEAFLQPDGKRMPLLRPGEEVPPALQERHKMRTRNLTLAIPAAALRKGVNVLAIQNHRAACYKGTGYNGPDWPTSGLKAIRLTAANPDGLTPNIGTPKGVHVWNVGLTTMVGAEVSEPDPLVELIPIKLQAPLGGEGSGQVIVSADKPLVGLKAVCSDLKGPGGAKIPSSAVRVRYAQRGGKYVRHANPFDALTDKPMADRKLQPVWVTATVPANAKPGKYTGTLALTAPTTQKVPVELTVYGWALPDPKRWKSKASFFQSPENLAKYYEVPLWSDAHFKLIERSLVLQGKLGDKVAHVLGVGAATGNASLGAETMVVYKRDGKKIKPDFTTVERYLKLYLNRMRSYLAAGLLFALPLIAGAQTKSAEAEKKMRTLRAHVETLRKVRDQLRAAIKEPASPARVIEIQLKDAISSRDNWGKQGKIGVVVTLYEGGGKVFALPARDLYSNRIRHMIDASGLIVEQGRISGAMTIHFMSLKEAKVVVTLDAGIEGEAVKGTYRMQTPEVSVSLGWGASPWVSPRDGKVDGTVRIADVTVKLPPTPEVNLMSGTVYHDKYDEARWLDQTSTVLFQEIRALAIARDNDVPFAHAWLMRLLVSPIYPALPNLSKSGKVRGKGKQPTMDDLLDDGMDLDLDAGEEPPTEETAKAPEDNDEKLAEPFTKLVAPILDRVAQRTKLAQAAGARKGGKPMIGSQDAGDPLFGPYYGEGGLEKKGKRANVVPASAGSAGPQLWPWITNWETVGPVPVPYRGLDCTLLPDLVPPFGSDLPGDKSIQPGGKRDSPLDLFPSALAEIQGGTGFVRPATARSFEDHGPQRIKFENGTFYAASELNAEAAGDLWFGVILNDHGKLWLNGLLVWTSPMIKVRTWSQQETYLFKAKVRKGRNELLFRCDNDMGDAFFSLRVCTRGVPGAGAKLAAALAATQKKAGSPAAGIQGWRWDGNGVYPGSGAPLAWEPDKKINILWQARYGDGHATPVIAGGRVFITEHPHHLICLDKMTGKELWRVICDVGKLQTGALKAEAQELRARVDAARAELAKLGPDRDKQIAALVAQGMSQAEAQAKHRALASEDGKYYEFLKRKCGSHQAGWGTIVGDAYGTPLTDGKSIWFKSNTGAIGCYDLDGNEKWLADHRLSAGTCAAAGSPLLVGDPLAAPLRAKTWRPAGFPNPKPRDLPKLMKAAERGNLVLRRRAVDAIGELGTAASSAVPLLGRLLDDPDDLLAFAAARALAAMPKNAAVLLPDIVKRIEGTDRRQRKMGLIAFRAVSRHAKGSYMPVIRVLGANPNAKDPRDRDERGWAMDALRSAGAAAAPDLARILTMDRDHLPGMGRVLVGNARAPCRSHSTT